ncbi:MAG: Holliday junction branch migration protein RuvA [Butyrivibrio sp.]|nr:Holliday junction branch migration protein RuvA [Butyrivibrio sp.]
MITYVRGQLTEVTANSIVLEAYGIGYEIMIPASMFGKLDSIGNEMKIYTYQNVKEDALDLYGFLTRDDLEIFKLLITVNGIGPKGALNILSAMTPDDLRIAVLSDDVKKIQSAPGIGGKTAQKVILDLKDKLTLSDIVSTGDIIPDNNAVASGAKEEAIEALASLGYSASEALKTVNGLQLTEDMDSEDILKAALKKLAFM